VAFDFSRQERSSEAGRPFYPARHESAQLGAEFAMPPTEVTGSTIAQLNDTCGNLIQITQLARLVGRAFSTMGGVCWDCLVISVLSLR